MLWLLIRSAEYPQHMFSSRNKKDISIFQMIKALYLLLCTPYDCINTIYQFIKAFLDNKMSIFEEYEAFEEVPVYLSKYSKNASLNKYFIKHQNAFKRNGYALGDPTLIKIIFISLLKRGLY